MKNLPDQIWIERGEDVVSEPATAAGTPYLRDDPAARGTSILVRVYDPDAPLVIDYPGKDFQC